MAVQHQYEGFGVLLRRHRRTAGLSQEALAEQAGLSARTISDLERGVKTRPHPATMRLLADALDLDAGDRAELAAAARPDRATTRQQAPGGVPLPTTPLAGRTEDLATAIDLVQASTVRVLTLTGPGGVGKTRLSLEIARLVPPDIGNDAAYVALESVTGAALVASSVAAALGVQERSTRAPVEAIRDHVRDRRMLLVLDNCEHVLDGVRPLVADLVANAPGLRILATSRSPLRVRGEHLLPLAPLAVPDPETMGSAGEAADIPAVAIFVARARAARPDFALTDGNVRDVVAICHRLDGLPLAIELAAIRMRALSPAALAGLLSERLRLLTTGPHDAPERQRTMRAAIAWSHELLDDDQQVLLRRLSVFAGGCTLEAAAAVATEDDPFAALDGIEALVDQGLLLRDDAGEGDPRFGMLATVREYALEHLDASDEAVGMRARHAGWAVALAEQAGPMLSGPEPGTWLRKLERERDNIRAALAWSLGDTGDDGDPGLALRLATAQLRYWHMRGDFQESHGWLERAIAQGDKVEPIARASAFLKLASMANNLEDHDRAERLYQESRRLFDELADMGGVGRASVGLGIVATNRGNYKLAASCLQQAREGSGMGNSAVTISLLYALGRLDVAQGNLDEARTRFTEAQQRCPTEQAGTLAYLSLELAQVARFRGDTASALRLVERCLNTFRDIGERRAEAASLAELGHLAFRRNDLDGAATLFREAAALHQELRDELGMIHCLEGMVGVAIARGEPALAARLDGAASAWRDRVGTVRLLPERGEIERLLATARESLGTTRFDSTWHEGRLSSLEDSLVRIDESTTVSRSRQGRPSTHSG